VVALAACVLFTALGGLSHWRGILAGHVGLKHTVLVRSTYGKLQIDIHRTDARERARWIGSTWPHPFALAEPNLAGWWRNGGFSRSEGGTGGGNSVQQIMIPFWALALLSLLFAAPLLLVKPEPREKIVRDWRDSWAAGRYKGNTATNGREGQTPERELADVGGQTAGGDTVAGSPGSR